MEIHTHLAINPSLCGTPTTLAPNEATVSLLTLPEMAADSRGLVHGGFVFGLADYAAMLAVNDPLVVLGGADTRFLAPVRVGQTAIARAVRTEQKGRMHRVEVLVAVEDRTVFTGTFATFVLDQHVLEPS